MRGGLFSKPGKIIFVLEAVVISLVVFLGPTQALELSNRSVQISSAVPSAVTTETFQFTEQQSTPLGSFVFLYCSNTPLFGQPCAAPSGLDVSNAVLTSQLGNVGFSIDTADTTANQIVLSRVSSPSTAIASSYVFD